MTFQAYLDNIQAKTGKSADELVGLAKKKGFLSPDTKATQVVEWLRDDFDLGHGHSMAIWLLIKQTRDR